jgi:hypothetical protein
MCFRSARRAARRLCRNGSARKPSHLTSKSQSGWLKGLGLRPSVIVWKCGTGTQISISNFAYSPTILSEHRNHPLAESREVTITKRKPQSEPKLLKGWQQIAAFLGLPISAAQRWAKSGMPVSRDGRRVQASPEELNRWLGHQASEPVQIATESTDLSAELRRGLSYVRKQERAQNKKKAA